MRCLEFDAVVLATGYVRDLHETMLKPLRHLLEKSPDDAGRVGWTVDEKYRVVFPDENVDSSEAGIWLQGCNEKTHGVCLFPLFFSLSHLPSRSIITGARLFWTSVNVSWCS